MSRFLRQLFDDVPVNPMLLSFSTRIDVGLFLTLTGRVSSPAVRHQDINDDSHCMIHSKDGASAYQESRLTGRDWSVQHTSRQDCDEGR